MNKSKSKTTMSKETERTLENMQDSDLKCLLDEVCSYKHTGDMQGKSPLVQGLLKQAEESESGEESIKRRPPKRHKKPKERRRRKESDSLAARTHAGGSLDNISGEKAAQTAARQRGVAGRTREGGSCCNLSRGSFETTVARRRRRRDPHRQHGGSLEDLSAIDETSAGAGRAKSSVSESGKHGGSLQNINQEGSGDFRPPAAAAAAAAAASTSVTTVYVSAAAPTAAAISAAAAAAAAAPPPTVIDIDDEDLSSRAALRASPRGRSEPTEPPSRPTATEEARADATVDFPLRLDPRQQQHQQQSSPPQQREPPRPAPYSTPAGQLDMESIDRNLGHLMSTRSAGYTRDEVRDMPPAELLTPSQRRSQQASEGGGGGGGGGGPSPGVSNGQRLNSSNTTGSGRIRKTKKKEEQKQRTEDVEGYCGKADLETILGFIESGDKKDKNGNKKADKAKDGKKDTRNRKNGVRPGEEERSGRADRSAGGRGTERRPSGRGGGAAAAGGKTAPTGRSSSLEARPPPTAAAAGAAAAAAAAGRTDGSSVFCGDLAKSSLKKSDSTPAAPCRPPAAGPSVVAFDGGTYVSPPAAERESEGFVQDFYSVTTDSTAIEETEFHVVTRKQRRRGGARAGAGDASRPHYALRHKTSSLDESARARHDSLGQPRRPYVPGLRQATSVSAPHSELSDSDSDGAGSLPPPPPPPSIVDPGGGGGRKVRASPPPSSAPAPAPATALSAVSGSNSGGGVSSWADVTRNRHENHTTGPTPIPTTPTPTPSVARPPQPAAGTRDAETSTDFIDGVGPIFGERSSPRGRPVAAVAAFVRGASEPTDCLIGGSHPDEFPEIAPAPATAAAAVAKSPRAGPVPPAGAGAASPAAAAVAAVSAGGSADGASAAPVTSQATASAVVSAAVTVPAGAAQADTRPAVSVQTSASGAAAAAPDPAVAAAATSPDANSATSGGSSSAAAPAARPSSEVNNVSDRRAAAPAAAPAARRTKKAPAVTIRGTLEDMGAPGAASAHMQGIQFGYIDAWSEPERPGGAPRLRSPGATVSAVEVFCNRFRPPPVDVTRFNWSECSIYLNKVYDEAARDPSAFFAASEAQNGLPMAPH